MRERQRNCRRNPGKGGCIQGFLSERLQIFVNISKAAGRPNCADALRLFVALRRAVRMRVLLRYYKLRLISSAPERTPTQNFMLTSPRSENKSTESMQNSPFPAESMLWLY
jgi:hypothetical protein